MQMHADSLNSFKEIQQTRLPATILWHPPVPALRFPALPERFRRFLCRLPLRLGACFCLARRSSCSPESASLRAVSSSVGLHQELEHCLVCCGLSGRLKLLSCCTTVPLGAISLRLDPEAQTRGPGCLAATAISSVSATCLHRLWLLAVRPGCLTAAAAATVVTA